MIIKRVKSNSLLLASLLFGLIAVSLIYLGEILRRQEFELWQAITVISGMSVMASFTYIHNYLANVYETHNKNLETDSSLEDDYRREKIEVSYMSGDFIEASIVTAFNKLIDEKRFQEINNDLTHTPHWQVTSENLVSVDNSLALAKLRIDLESSLRRLASNHEINISAKYLTIRKLTRLLAEKDILPSEVLHPIEEVIGACNAGIHLNSVPDEETSRIVELGNQIIKRITYITELIR